MVLPGDPDDFAAAWHSPWQRRCQGLGPSGVQSLGGAYNGGARTATAWRMKEIDEMNMLGFLRLRAWDATREQEKKKPRQRFIDEVWPGVKPG